MKKLILLLASLILCVGMSATQALAAVCDDAATRCDDGNVCTDDSCGPDTGDCIHTDTPVCIYTVNNNFSMFDPAGGPVGGQQDVVFEWNGSLKTSVAVSGQIPNATISGAALFFGSSWWSHDVTLYGPGTYTVYAGCPAGSPGCGTGTPITFTVVDGEIGGHMLFNWTISSDIDLVNIWVHNAVFAPSPLWTWPTPGSDTPPADKVWDMMSKDWDNNGINSYGFVDGPFNNFNGNFNLMVCWGGCDDYDSCTTDTCDMSSGFCVFTPIVCPGGGACDPVAGCGKCFDAAIRCNDNNDCTTDTCIEDTGACEHANNTSVCDDGNLCTIGDVCSNGVCAGTAVVCAEDNNVCTGPGVCASATGLCSYLPVADGTPCSNATGLCFSGVCMPVLCGIPNVTIKGGGQKASVDAQIQTTFKVTNISSGGCIVSYTNNSVTVMPGTNLTIDWTGSSPAVSTSSLNGASVPAGSILPLNNVMSTNKLYLDNKGMGGSDTDRISIKN